MAAESIFVLPKLLPRERAVERVAGFLTRLPVEKAWRVSVTEQRRTRTNQQNRYLFGIVYPTILQGGGESLAGWDAKDLHEFFLGEHFGWKDKRVPKTPRNPEGIESVPVRTTTRDEFGNRAVLNKQDFSDYVAFIQRFAATKGVYVPDPEDFDGAS